MTARLKTLLLTTSFLGGLVGVALADPATLVTTANLRAGPGTEYPARITIPGGATIDVRGCDGAWCVVSYAGYEGYVAQSLIAAADGQGPAIAAVPDDEYYDDGPYPYYGYGYGYAYGGHRRDWQDHNRRGGNWQGRGNNPQLGNRGVIQQGRGNWQGNGGGNRQIGVQGAPRAQPQVNTRGGAGARVPAQAPAATPQVGSRMGGG